MLFAPFFDTPFLCPFSKVQVLCGKRSRMFGGVRDGVDDGPACSICIRGF